MHINGYVISMSLRQSELIVLSKMELVNLREVIKVDEATYESIKDIYVIDLGLSSRAQNCLLKTGVFTVGQLLEKKRAELISIPNMGTGSLNEIENKLTLLINRDNRPTEGAVDSSAISDSGKHILDSENEFLDYITIEKLGLSVRSKNALEHNGIRFVGQFRDIKESDLYHIHGLGSGSIQEILGAIKAFAENSIYKYVTLDNIEYIDAGFFETEEFTALVAERIGDMFDSKEINSMSFFDIWNGISASVPENAIREQIDKLINKGIIEYSDDAYHFEYPSILDAIKVLPDKYRDVISLKLQGKKYAEIAEQYGVTRSWVQQVAAKGINAIFKGAKGIAPIKRVKEDEYRTLFQSYDISLSEWVINLKKPDYAYRYLAMRYKRGERRLPGAESVNIKERRTAATKSSWESIEIINKGTLDDFINYYKSLAAIQKDILLYSDEEQYIKDIARLSKRVNREIAKKKYISDIRITDQEYQMLRGYLHYAVILLNKTAIAPDEAMFAAAVINVAIKSYKDGNLWGNFFNEIEIKQNPTLQKKIGQTLYNILEKYDLARGEAGDYFQNILLHCFISDYYANSFFDFLFNFYRIDLDRDISRLDRDTMRALMDSICAEENVGRTYMLVQHIGQAMAANRRGATIRIRNHMKLLDKFFWDDSFEINTTHRLNNLMQKWARSSAEVIGEMETYSTGRRRGAKRFAAPFIAFDDESRECVLTIPAQSIKRYDSEEIYWKASGAINRKFEVELAESVIGYKVLESMWDISMNQALSDIQLELMTAEGEVIKRFLIKGTDVRFFDNEGYPVNAKNIKVGDVISISREDTAIKSSALYDTDIIDGMLISFFHFEYEDILHMPNGNVVIVGRPEITNSIAGKGRIEGATCRMNDIKDGLDLYGKIPYLVLRMREEKFNGTAVSINGRRYRLGDLKYESFSIDDRTGDSGYYIDLAGYLGNKDDLYRISVDIPGGASPHWEFVYIKGFEVSFEEAPYVFEPRGTVVFSDHIEIKDINESCKREPGINGFKFEIHEVGRNLEFNTSVGDKIVDISIPVPAFFIKNAYGEWDSRIPTPVWHADLPDVIDLSVPHHNIKLYLDDVLSDSGDTEREVTYRKNQGDDHILCDITKFKSYLSGDDIARQLKMRFGDVDMNLMTIIIHSKVITLQIIGDYDANEIIVNADISGKASYYVDIHKAGELITEKAPLVNGTTRIRHEIGNGLYEVEVFELVEDDSGFGGEDYYSIGIYNQEMINPYDMTDRSFMIIQIEGAENATEILPLKFRINVLDLKRTDDNHLYNGTMVVKKSFYKGSEIAALPVTVRFDDLSQPNYAWISFVDDEFGDEMDFLYDTRKQGILQEENLYLKPMVCYRRYTFLNDEEYIYHIDFINEHYSSYYNELSEMIVYPENNTKIHFRENRFDSKRNRFEVKSNSGNVKVYSNEFIFIGDAPLQSKTKMHLRNARINTLNEIAKMTKTDLAKRSSADIKMIRDIENALLQYGMAFRKMEGEE